MSRRIATFIVRLYPRRWRERYEQEMCDLLEQRPVTIGQLWDLSAAVIRERGAEFLSLNVLFGPWGIGALIAFLALVIASLLHRRFGMLPQFQPIFTPSAEGTIVRSAPIDGLGFIAPVVMLVALLRAVAANVIQIEWRIIRWARVGRSVGRVELALWVVVLLVASTVAQLIQLGWQHGVPGSPSYSSQWIWTQSAVQTIATLQPVIVSTTWFRNRVELARAKSDNEPAGPHDILELNA